MNLHLLCDFSLGQAEAALIVPGCLFAVTRAVSKPPFSIPTSLNCVRSALWPLTMKRKDIQKHQLCLPCRLKLSFVEVWRVSTITAGGSCWVVPHQCPCHAAGARGEPPHQERPNTSLHSKHSRTVPQLPPETEGLRSPKCFHTEHTHIPSPAHFCIWLLIPPSHGLDLFQQYFSVMGEGRKWKNNMLCLLRRKTLSDPSLRWCKGKSIVSLWRIGPFSIEGISDFTTSWKGRINIS